MTDIIPADTAPEGTLHPEMAQAATVAGTTSTLNQLALDALVSLRAYRDAASPTTAQTVAVVKLLCRVAIALIRFRLNKLDAAD